MLRRENRLSKTGEVEQTVRRGQSFHSRAFSVRTLPALSPRFAVVVSTRVSKRAVKRNRIKRLVRTLISAKISKFPPANYVVSAKPGCLKFTEEQYMADIYELFAKIVTAKRRP